MSVRYRATPMPEWNGENETESVADELADELAAVSISDVDTMLLALPEGIAELREARLYKVASHEVAAKREARIAADVDSEIADMTVTCNRLVAEWLRMSEWATYTSAERRRFASLQARIPRLEADIQRWREVWMEHCATASAHRETAALLRRVANVTATATSAR